jgi:hypothetical protein
VYYKRPFSSESAVKIGRLKASLPFDAANPYTETLQKYEELAEQIGYKLAYHDFVNNHPTLKD